MDRVIRKKGTSTKNAIIGFCSLIGLLSISYWYFGFVNIKKISVSQERASISEVKAGVFKEYIPVTGTILPILSVFIAAPEGGQLEKKYVESGTMIEKGEPILTFANRDLQMETLNRQAQFLEQQNNLRNTLLSLEKQNTQNKKEMLQIELELKQSKKLLEINEGLAQDKLIPQQELEKSKDQFKYLLGKKSLLENEMKNDSVFRVEQNAQIQSSFSIIQKSLEILANNLNGLILTAPVSGQLSSLKAEIGETKQKGENIAQIDVIDKFKVRVKISEHYATRIQPGLSGSFESMGNTYSLTITKIYPEISSGEFDADMEFNANVPEDLKRGKTFQVKLRLGEESQATLLSRGPFFNESGGAWIYVVEKNIARKRKIKLGRQNPEYYEVLEGLSPGEKAITSSYEGFQNADEINIKQSK